MHGETIAVITKFATGFPIVTAKYLVATFFFIFVFVFLFCFHLEEGCVVM